MRPARRRGGAALTAVALGGSEADNSTTSAGLGA
jgi:hypothetical protein